VLGVVVVCSVGCCNILQHRNTCLCVLECGLGFVKDGQGRSEGQGGEQGQGEAGG